MKSYVNKCSCNSLLIIVNNKKQSLSKEKNCTVTETELKNWDFKKCVSNTHMQKEKSQLIKANQ